MSEEKEMIESASPEQTTSENSLSSAKILGAVGKGLQAAGGPVTTERAMNAIRLGITSIVRSGDGGVAQSKAQEDLVRSHIVLTENDLMNLESDQNKLSR